jgi:phytoene dehydrogenase-like protein
MPRGGAGALSDALAAHLRSLGGVIRSDSPVLQLDDVPTAGPILFDTSPHRLADIAGDALPLGFRRALQRYTYGPGIFKIDYALDAPIPWRDPVCAGAGTVHLGGSFEEIAASEAAPWRGEHAERPYVLLAQQSMFDPTRAPEGQHTGWAYCHVPNGSTQDMTEAIETQIERFAPGFKDTVLARHRWTTMTMEAHNPNLVGGDVVGGAATIDQLFTRPVRRAVPYSTPNPRIWLGSASTPPGGGVHGMCGHHAAKALLKRWPV